MSAAKKIFSLAAAGLAALYLLLMVPLPEGREAAGNSEGSPFAWNKDGYWARLEDSFSRARGRDPGELARLIDGEFDGLGPALSKLRAETLGPGDPLFEDLERALFELAPPVAALGRRRHGDGRVERYFRLCVEVRDLVKEQSRRWDMGPESREVLYRLVYGLRMAAEEVMLQLPEGTFSPVAGGAPLPSASPSREILGVRVHSGDLLVSRGGAPTSALIARGNDFPGNFSHVALVHVDGETGELSIIESHIESGVSVSTPDAYLADRKLRIMLLRLRSDLPSVEKDPLLPHRAAERVIARARREHIPYDFAMDFSDHARLFCSEVASAGYEGENVRLWMELSRISGRGVVSWLRAFGVEHFRTQAPSDLEYDPQLAVVKEWRDPATLRQDHVDNAVIDAMLEMADGGAELRYNPFLLPIARLAKAWSVLLNRFGRVGPVPEGMSAAGALRNEWFSRVHGEIQRKVLEEAERFETERGYAPLYWQLVEMARRHAGAGNGVMSSVFNCTVFCYLAA